MPNPQSIMPDQVQLLKDCLKGKREAQRKLYEHFAPLMMAVCYRYTKSKYEAEDVLQEGFVKVFNSLDQFRGDGEIGAWIRRIMVNTALNYLRTHKKYQQDADVDMVPERASNDENPLASLQAKQLADIIQRLPTGYQTIFNLYVVEGYSHVEIGEMLGIDAGTSRSQYLRARVMLQKWIEEETQLTTKNQ